METFSEWLARKNAVPSFRADGTLKGQGYFGSLPGPGGTTMTEYSIGVTGPEYGWKETEIPLLVPTLTEEEIKYLQSGGEPTPEIERKARAFVEQRRGTEKSPFAQAGEQQPPPGEPRKRPSFSEWLAQKAGKAPISGFPGVMATPLAPPPRKGVPWGGLARGPRVPGLPQVSVSPKAMIAGTGAPGEVMPSEQMYKYLSPEEQAAWQEWHKRILGQGELIPERETLPPSAQRAFKRRQENIEHYLETGQPLIPKVKLGLSKIDEWKQTKEGNLEYMPTIMEKLSDKIATGQDLSKIESIGNRALMLSTGLVNGYTAGVFSDAFKDQMIPQDVVDELLYQGVHLAGWMKGWPALVGKIFHGEITKPAIDALSKVVKAAPKTQAWLQYMGGSTRLGAMSAASDLNQKPEEIVKAGIEGTALGAVFHGTALLDFFKSPVINQMARQFGSRALANLIGAYDPKIITALKDDPAQALPAIVDEIFMSVFSAPGKSAGKMMKEWHQAQGEIAKYNREYKTQIKTSPEIGRIIRNLGAMEELAFHPGTEKRQEVLQQENTNLIKMYRERHALVPITAGKTFEVSPEGKITPPGIPEAQIRVRQRLEQIHEKKRQAEELAIKTKEQEAERQTRLPVPVSGEVSPEPGRSPRFHIGPNGEVVVTPELAWKGEGEGEAQQLRRGYIEERQQAVKQRRIEEEAAAKEKLAEAPPVPETIKKPSVVEPIPKGKELPRALPGTEYVVRSKEAIKELRRASPEEARADLERISKGTIFEPSIEEKPTAPVKPVKAEVTPPSAAEPAGFARHIPSGKYALRGNFLYKGNRPVFDLGVMAKDLVYKLQDAKKRAEAGSLSSEGYEKIKKQIMNQASKEYESYNPPKEFPKPTEVYKAKEARVAREREIVANAIKAGRQKIEQLKPWTEEAEKSQLALTLEEHRDFKDKQFKEILKVMVPEKKTKKKPGLGLSVEYKEKNSWFDDEDIKKINEIFGKPGAGEIEFKKVEGRTSHAGMAGFSQEALSRPQRFIMYDSRTRRYRPLGKLEGIDQTPAPHEVKFAINNTTNKVAWTDKGSDIAIPVPDLIKKVEGDLPKIGLNLQMVTPRSREDVELDRALAERRIPGTDIRIPPGEKIDSASDFVIRSETKEAGEKEKHWIPGFTVLDNFKRMGPVGKSIAKSGDKFIFEQNSDTSRDQWLAKGAQKMIAHSMKQGGELKNIPFLKRSEEIGKRIIDLVENKVKPGNEHELAAKGIIKEIFKDMAQQSEILGLKIKTAFGREVPWAERENYFPQAWKKAGLEKFLTSEELPFRHLRDIYVEYLAKKMDPDLFQSNPKEATRQVEMRWREMRNDLKSRPFANLEMSRILDEEVLGKLQIKWATAYPNEKFPLERDTGLHVLMNYISGGRTRLAWVRNFGKDVRTEKGDFAPELIYDAIPKMTNQANYDYTLNFFRQYLTRSGFDTKTTRLMRDIRTAQLWKLGTAFIPNSSQWFTNVLPLVSTRSGLQGLFDATKVVRNNPQMKEYFMKSGARTMKSAMREALMEDTSKINGFADAMLKVHLFNGTEAWNAIYSAMTGGRKAIEVSKKLAERPEAYRYKAWENELKKLGLEESDIARIKGGKPIEMGSPEYLRAMFEMRKNTQFLSDAFHLPKSWSHPFGRLATQFKNFAYNQTRLIITEPMADAWKFVKTNGREGDLAKLMKAMIILPAAGAAIVKAREETYKLFGIHFYEELMAGRSWPEKYLIFMANAGSLGIAVDMLGAIGYGTKGMVQLLGGPSASDILGFTEAMGNTWKEINTSIEHKNPEWLKHRGTAIKEYWLRFGERLAPDVRIAIQNLFSDWKDAKTATNWSAVYKEATKKFKETYKLKGEYEADQFWDAWMATQGKEYAEIFGKQPRKPTPKEIDQWWEEMGKPTTERMKMPGISEDEKKNSEGTYIW